MVFNSMVGLVHANEWRKQKKRNRTNFIDEKGYKVSTKTNLLNFFKWCFGLPWNNGLSKMSKKNFHSVNIFSAIQKMFFHTSIKIK